MIASDVITDAEKDVEIVVEIVFDIAVETVVETVVEAVIETVVVETVVKIVLDNDVESNRHRPQSHPRPAITAHMTAVAAPPSFVSRPWADERGMLRKQLSRSNSSSSASSTSSLSSNTTTSASDLQWSRKRPKSWSKDDLRLAPRPNGQPQMARPEPPQASPTQLPPGQPVLYLLSLNGTFERKTIAVPFAPDSLRIGRQTNQKTVPTPANGFFDSKVLSRQHAEIFAERNGKIYIRDVKSSNGTFVNGTRLSQENRESEPHELQTADHLELGIDIVSEDQKTVVHHKVAAKVEHAGFLSNTSNVLDMNFGDLDPANGMLVPNGPRRPMGRPAPVNGQRPFFLAPIATDQILKRLTAEMRNARLQAQDLSRTNQFVRTLLSKDDVKDLEREEPKMFRDKTRFSDPPAPPPQQPLPEKPDQRKLKSPVRDVQIMQLTEALNNARRDFDSQAVRLRELEGMLAREREARELAEDVARRLKDRTGATLDADAVGAASVEAHERELDDGIASGSAGEGGLREEASGPNSAPGPTLSVDTTFEQSVDEVTPTSTQSSTERHVAALGKAPEVASSDAASDTKADGLPDGQAVTSPDVTNLLARINSMDGQMRQLREQLQTWRQRCETAESERDTERASLADMVLRLRAKAEAEGQAQAHAQARADRKPSRGAGKAPPVSAKRQAGGTMTASAPGTRAMELQEVLPFASMLGVVLIGMGFMAYINGWSDGRSIRYER
ncbi:hypothetical protein RJ55_07770 [Drechmeria coniospora]|nr:hypothetical protein RJ55_07770 [Drechmeria coniospora]